MGNAFGKPFDVLSCEHGFAKPIFFGCEVALVVGDASRHGFNFFCNVFDASCDVIEIGLVLVAKIAEVESHGTHVYGDERGDDSRD